MLRISAIIMAAGMSKRMKRDKLRMKINDKPIYEYILDTLVNYPFYEKIIVARDDEILRKAENLGFLAVKNFKYFLGKSESIKAGLKAIKETEGVMFFVADQPFIKPETIDTLCREFHDNPSKIILPCYNGSLGNPVIFPFFLKDQLMALENDQGGKVVIAKNRNKIIKVDILTNNESMDIDTLEDYKNALKLNIIS
jgi:molybdenum cofactor cytidylyltransferase